MIMLLVLKSYIGTFEEQAFDTLLPNKLPKIRTQPEHPPSLFLSPTTFFWVGIKMSFLFLAFPHYKMSFKLHQKGLIPPHFAHIFLMTDK